MGLVLETLERPKARDRQRHGQTVPGRNASETFTEAFRPVRDVVGAQVGMSGVTYQRARAVVQAAGAIYCFGCPPRELRS